MSPIRCRNKRAFGANPLQGSAAAGSGLRSKKRSSIVAAAVRVHNTNKSSYEARWKSPVDAPDYNFTIVSNKHCYKATTEQ